MTGKELLNKCSYYAGDRCVSRRDIEVSTSMRAYLFLALNVLGAALFFKPLLHVVSLSFQYQMLYSHIPLIALISGVFLFRKRKELFSRCAFAWRPGLLLYGLSAAVYCAGFRFGPQLAANDYLSLMMAALVLWFWAGALLVFGTETFRKALFPLLFLLFTVPLPNIVLKPYIHFLQAGTAATVHGFLEVTGIPYIREGYYFTVPGFRAEIAEECSGIRSSIVLFIVSILVGHLYLRTVSRKTLLAAAVFPIAIVKNALRITVLIYLTAYVDPKFVTDSWLHQSGGIPLFVLSLVLLAGAVFVLKKTEHKILKKQHGNGESAGDPDPAEQLSSADR